jgi:chemotaxis protein CheD
MKKPDHTVEIFLHQGDVYFGDRDTRIRTVLGSCVAITMWHPQLLLGGMCHYMLPGRRRTAKEALDGKYADEALELMLTEIRRSGTRPSEYQIKLFGGGNMFPSSTKMREQHVGLRNVEAGRELLARHGLKIHAEHLGGLGHRNLLFDIWSGHVWMKHQVPANSTCNDECKNCESREVCLPA